MSFLTRSQHMGAAALIMGLSVFLSRFMGLIRDKVISYFYGAGSEAGIYFVSFVVPDFINYLLAGGYFSITLIPLLSRRFQESQEEGWSFFSTIFSWVCVASVSACSLAWVFAPQLAQVVAPGFSPAESARLSYFLRIILPAQVFFLPGACFTAILFWRRQFSAPAFTPLIYNGCIIIGGLISQYIAPEKGMEGFCWGVLGGAFAGSFLLPFMAVRSGGCALRLSFRDTGVKAFLALALPLMIGQSIVALDEQFIRIFGSMAGPDAVSLLSYARRIMLVPVGVVAQAAGVASYPFLASLAAAGDHRRFAGTLNTALKNTLALTIPLCIWMAAAATPILRLIFQQGKFTATETEASALLLAIMMSAVAFWAVQQLISRAFYAYGDTLTPAVAGTLITLASLPVYWGLVMGLGTPGVALAGIIAVTVYTVVLSLLWRKKHSDECFSGLNRHVLAACAFSLFPGLAAYAVCVHLPGLLDGAQQRPLATAFICIAVSGMLFAAGYLPFALRVPSLAAPLLPLWQRWQRIRQRLRR